MPDYAFAVLSALAWAASAQVVNSGLRRIPAGTTLPSVFAGLLISLATGSLILLAVVGPPTAAAAASVELVLAGILTFPVGTGLYYLCGHAFRGRMEFASQFANVKPLFSILLAYLVLGESIGPESAVATGLVAAGVAALFAATARGDFSWDALLLGLLLAVSWAGGEAFIKLGVGDGPSLAATAVSLASGTALGILVIGPFVLLRRAALTGAGVWAWAFVGHGVLSFFVAYSALFESIRQIGLARTVLINAFWPALAVALALGFARLRGRAAPVSPFMIVAILLLLAGSITQIAGL